MKRNFDVHTSCWSNRIIRRIALTILVIFMGLLIPVTSGFAQNQIDHLVLKDVTLAQAVKKLGEIGNYKFVFNYDALNKYKVNVNIENKSITESLDILLKDKPFQYEQKDEFIIIVSKKATTSNANDPKIKFTVKGVVTDEAGIPLPGVAILIKNTHTGMTTDADGAFSIQILTDKAILVFSFVGMKTKEILVNGDQTLNLVMQEEEKELDEVIVTGFQTISRERSSGAAVIVNKKDLETVSTRSISENLEGRVPGLLNYGGQIAIRGSSSFAVNSNPLIVIDGMPVENVTAGSSLLDGKVTQSINNINPEDIESVTVLKDAASTSLYGVRASNGVIVITTKRAKEGKININFDANFYFSPAPRLSYLDYASTSDIIDYELEYMKNSPAYQSDPQSYFANMNEPENWGTPVSQVKRIQYALVKNEITEEEAEAMFNKLRKNDYRKEYWNAIMRTSFIQDYNLSLAKGGKKSNLFFSMRYQGNQYNRKDYSEDKLSMYMKNIMNLTNWFTFTYGANINYENSASSGTEKLSPTIAMPYERLYNDNGGYEYLYFINYDHAQELNQTEGLNFMGYNVIEDLQYSHIKNNTLNIRMFSHADLNIYKGLKLGLKFQYEDIISEMEQYDQEESYKMRFMINQFATTDQRGKITYQLPQGGYMSETWRRYKNINFRTQLDYQHMFGEKHDLAVLAGIELRQNEARAKLNDRYGYNEQLLRSQENINWEALQTGVMGMVYARSQQLSPVRRVDDALHRYFSVYGNIGYTFDNRYSLTGSIRVEQADLFGTDPKYRYRPLWSVGAAWNIYQENFMQNIEFVNFLKMRFSYGITGNVDQTSSPFLIGQSNISMYTGNDIVFVNTPPNKLLRWEKTSTTNWGLDFKLFSRLEGNIDLYYRYSTDLLCTKKFDPSVGFASGKVNNGKMSNKGIELSLNYTWLQKNEWHFSTGITAAYNKNEIKKIDFEPVNALEVLYDPYNNYMKGDPYGSMYAYRYQGLTDEGNPSVLNEKEEVISINPVDNPKALVKVGQLTPKWNGAINLNVTWKGFELYSRFVYYTGHVLRNDVTPLYTGVSDGAIHKDFIYRWSPEHPDTDVPSMIKYDYQENSKNFWKYADIHKRNASFIKMRNLTLSYKLPKKFLEKLSLSEVRLRTQIDNLWYWAANHEGIDPESFDANNGSRTDEQRPTYSLGISIRF